MEHYLSLNKKGVLFHGALIQISNEAIILTGHSGAGKSTLSHAFSVRGYNKFADDRFIIEKGREDVFVCSSAPLDWKFDKWENLTLSLKAIVNLKHGINNNIEIMSASNAFKSLLQCNLLPHFVQNALEFFINFLKELTKEIPVFNYAFGLNERNVIDLVNKLS